MSVFGFSGGNSKALCDRMIAAEDQKFEEMEQLKQQEANAIVTSNAQLSGQPSTSRAVIYIFIHLKASGTLSNAQIQKSVSGQVAGQPNLPVPTPIANQMPQAVNHQASQTNLPITTQAVNNVPGHAFAPNQSMGQPAYQQMGQPGMSQPVYQQMGQPGMGQPAYQQMGQPAMGQQVYQQVVQPGMGQPVYQQMGQPGMGQPVYQQMGQPGVGQPAYQQMGQPGMVQPMYQAMGAAPGGQAYTQIPQQMMGQVNYQVAGVGIPNQSAAAYQPPNTIIDDGKQFPSGNSLALSKTKSEVKKYDDEEEDDGGFFGIGSMGSSLKLSHASLKKEDSITGQSAEDMIKARGFDLSNPLA
ncbi:hypothetical protein HDV02_005808 [Globomyces sp. JEL0801]|nr:hypothetical protein HDV02_005808 [Globomyces sp. JEL0801]